MMMKKMIRIKRINVMRTKLIMIIRVEEEEREMKSKEKVIEVIEIERNFGTRQGAGEQKRENDEKRQEKGRKLTMDK